MTTRYFGMDIHKETATIAIVDRDQHVVQSPYQISMDTLEQWAAKTLTQKDCVVIEVTTNSWNTYDVLVQYAGQVVVANPYKTRLIAEARIKTDKVDALVLARLLASQFICDVWVPAATVRQQRALASHRAGLSRQATHVKNRIYALLFRHNYRCPVDNLFSRAGRAWLESLALSSTETLERNQLLQQLDLLQQQRAEAEQKIAQLAAEDDRVPRLMQIPGIGCFTAFAILATIGTIDRFESPKKLTSFAGLVPSRHQSANRSYNGSITKSGSPILRWLMVEAARTAVRFDPHWQQVFQRIQRSRGNNIAIVAVARKLLVVIWHLLRHQSPYRHLKPKTFVNKLQNLAFSIGRHHLPDSTSLAFTQRILRRLGFGSLADSLVSNKRGKILVPIS